MIVLIALVLFAAFAWSLRNLVLGRTVYAVGSDTEAARLAGINSPNVVFWVFVIMGGLVGVASLLNAIRFTAIPGNFGSRP